MNTQHLKKKLHVQPDASQHLIALQDRPCSALILILENGDLQALSYPYLYAGKLIDRRTIYLDFGTRQVEMEGRNLLNLFTQLMSHQVQSIRQVPHRLDHYPPTESLIHTINIIEP